MRDMIVSSFVMQFKWAIGTRAREVTSELEGKRNVVGPKSTLGLLKGLPG